MSFEEQDPYGKFMEDDDLGDPDAEAMEDQGYNSDEEYQDDNLDEEDQDDIAVVGSEGRDRDLLKKLLKIAFNSGITPETPMQRILTQIKGDREEVYEEEDIKPWEFLYDENYDEDLDRLMKDSKTREYQRRKVKSNKLLMNEVLEDWKGSERIVRCLMELINGKQKIDNVEVTEQFIDEIFNTCKFSAKELNKINPSLVESQEEYGWIDRWRELEENGGMGIVVKGKRFTGTMGLTEYNSKLINSINNKKQSSLISTQLSEISYDEILPFSKSNIGQIVDMQAENSVENTLFKQIGQVVIQPTATTLDDISNLMENMKIDRRYDIEDLTRDMQNRMKVKMSEDEKNNFKKNVNKLSGRVLLKDLFFDKSGTPIIRREPKLDEDIKNLSFIMENLSIKSLPYRYEDETNPYSSGLKKEGRVVSSEYPSTVKFIKPYKDPHFTFLNEVVETWVPKVHYVTGLPVFTEKAEILRYKKVGTVVYLKLQEVDVKIDDNKTINVIYFRKFVDFLDFMKSWQETYVKKVIEINTKIIEVIEKPLTGKTIKEIYNLITSRKIFIGKVKDIKKYFVLNYKNGLQKEKMEIYINDIVVESVIRPDDSVEGKILNFIDSSKEKLITKLSEYNSKKDSYETLLCIIEIKTIMGFFTRYFPDNGLSMKIKDTKKEKSICNILSSKLEPHYNDILGRLRDIQPNLSFIKDGQPSKNVKNVYASIMQSLSLFDELSDEYRKYISFFEKYLESDKYINRESFKELEISMKEKIKIYNDSLPELINSMIEFYKTNDKIELLNEITEIIRNGFKIDETNGWKISSLEKLNNVDYIGLYIKSKNKEEFAKSTYNLVITTFDILGSLIKYYELELSKFINTTLDSIPEILAIVKIIYEIKQYSFKLYMKYGKLVNYKFYNENEPSLEEKKSNIISIIQQRYLPTKDAGSIERMNKEIQNKILELEEYENGRDIKKLKTIQQQHNNIFSNKKLKSYSSYFSDCYTQEGRLYEYFKSIESTIKRKSKIQSREYGYKTKMKTPREQKTRVYNRKGSQDVYTMYNRLMGYLEGCSRVNKKR